MPLSEKDVRYMEWALGLAEKGRGRTSPNPLVGAVIVSNGAVLGEGYHTGPGHDHAEVAALKDAMRRAGLPVGHGENGCLQPARELFREATMYVTLEPCCTYGRTPPCTDALISAGIERVVVAVLDPSPDVNGRGVQMLRAAGVRVDFADDPLALRAKRQNGGMRKSVLQGLPFVTYKYAMTLDGRVAVDSGDSRWISSAESRALVHQWRAWSDAVVVGAGTAAADDPSLTARDVVCARQPVRVVVDAELGLRRDSRLVESVSAGPVLVVCAADTPAARRAEVESWGIETATVSRFTDGPLDPAAVGRELLSRDVQWVLLEGGPRLAGAWWSAGIIDRVAAFVCPRIASGVENRGPLRGSGALRMEDAVGLREIEVSGVGPDVLVVGYTGEAL